MRTAVNILAAAGVACVLLTGLALLINLFDPHEEGHQATQASLSVPYGTRLHDDNLVDYMARLQLKLGIRMVNWREPDLFVDLYVDQNGLSRLQIFQDIQEISRFALQTMKNVEHLYLRVYEGKRGEDAAMLLAVSADRRQLSKRQLDPMLDSAHDAEKIIKQEFRVQETARWSDLFGNFDQFMNDS